MKASLGYTLVLLAGLVSGISAQAAPNVDGKTLSVAEQMELCRNESDSMAKLDCFNKLTAALKGEADGAEAKVSVEQALDGLRSAAEYQGKETGVSIIGSSCFVQVLYYGNYFHISRRNVSTFDLISAKFDASKLQLDQVSDVAGPGIGWSKAVMTDGVKAISIGGLQLDSKKNKFPSKSAGESMSDYARAVAGQLVAREGPEFEFLLVHPDRAADSDKIWDAFETFVSACQA